MVDEDWEDLKHFFPENWEDLASETGVMVQLRKETAPEDYLRVLMMHLACNFSLRETSARAKASNLADLSDVAVMKRLQKAEGWLHAMCIVLFQEQGISPLRDNSGLNVRLLDASIVKEPGKNGAQWRIHYSLQLSTLMCDAFKLTLAKGPGTGESFSIHDISKDDHFIADRGYSTASGIHYVAEHEAYCTVRVNTASLPIQGMDGSKFPLLTKVKTLKRVGVAKSWDVQVPFKGKAVDGRICVIKKNKEAIKKSQEKVRKDAARKGHKVRPETLEYAKYIILFTTVPEKILTANEILELYRVRWQIELTFKRFKSITELGSLPKYRDDSSRAWIYGKLFVALLTEKMVRYAGSFSPWGYKIFTSE